MFTWTVTNEYGVNDKLKKENGELRNAITRAVNMLRVKATHPSDIIASKDDIADMLAAALQKEE